jgi:hypothetical protein
MGHILAVYVPYTVGDVRLGASEVRIAAEMIARLTTGDVAAHARMLAAHATRLENAAVLLSAVPSSSWRLRWAAAWRLLRGR